VKQKVPDHLHLGFGLTAPDSWLNVDGSWQVSLVRRPLLKKSLVVMSLLSRKQAEIPWKSQVIRLNLSRPLPFADEQFSVSYSSHLLEHLYFDDALALLKGCYRVLQPGGICRAVVPDLYAIAKRYIHQRELGIPDASIHFMEELMVHDKRVNTGLLGTFYRLTGFHQHKWMYDAESLQQLFLAAGFSNTRQAEYLDSRISRIREVEKAERILNGQGIAIEGVKC